MFSEYLSILSNLDADENTFIDDVNDIIANIDSIDISSSLYDVSNNEMIDLIESSIVGYLINKKIKVHGIVYGSKFHNIIGNFVND